MVVDEVWPCVGREPKDVGWLDWSTFENTSNKVDLLVAASPQIYDTSCKMLLAPANKTTLSSQLLQRHRNSYELQRLLLYFSQHSLSFQPFSSTLTEIYKESLPPGRPSVWLDLNDKISYVKAFEHIKCNLIREGESVSVIFNEAIYENDVEEWCREQGWKMFEFLGMGSSARGCEDQIMVIVGIINIFNISYLENLARARTMYVQVTRKGHQMRECYEKLFQEAVDHEKGICKDNKDKCQFLGEKLLLKYEI